jgi:hypothetical protein
MALPTRAELENKIGSGSSTPKRPNRALLEREAKASEAEASRSLTSRFLEELGINFRQMPKEIAQGTARSIASLPLAAIQGKEATITPESKFSQG